jgi:sugar phosphate isomerase/epimerase
MKIGICTSLENAVIARDAGFDYLEENVQALLMADEPEDIFVRKLHAVRRAPLPVIAANCFLPGAVKCTGPEVDDLHLARYVETAFRRAHEACLRFIVFGSGAARQIPDGFPRAHARVQMLGFLRRIAPRAQAHDITIVLECLNRKECNFITALAEGAELVEEVGHPHLRLLADIYHMSVDGEPPTEIVAQGRLLEHVHVAELKDRQAPGTSNEDFGPSLRALQQIGYRGAISYECGWKDFPKQAASSLKSFRQQVAAAGLGCSGGL